MTALKPTNHHFLDTTGLLCPLPVLKARKALSQMRPGETLILIATDPMARLDVAHMCAEDGHQIEEQKTDEPPFQFTITRGQMGVSENGETENSL